MIGAENAAIDAVFTNFLRVIGAISLSLSMII